MNIDQFWSTVDAGKDLGNPQAALIGELEKLAPEEIAQFQEHFDQQFDNAYRWDLWGAAYLLEGGCSDDGFTDFRYGLIARGRQVFESALQNPDSLAVFGDEPDIANESFGYVAQQVYEKKTSSEMPGKARAINDPLGDEWDFDNDAENQQRLPGIMAIRA